MTAFWLRLRIWFFKRQLAALQREVDYHHKHQKEYAYQAYYTEMMQAPMQWATLMTRANWHGNHKERTQKLLGRVRVHLSTLQSLQVV